MGLTTKVGIVFVVLWGGAYALTSGKPLLKSENVAYKCPLTQDVLTIKQWISKAH